MTTLTITHADWEALEAVPPGSATITPVSGTQFTISVPLGTSTAVFSVFGNFTNPQGMSAANWLATASGTVTSMTLAIDGVQQMNATGLTIGLSEILDDAVDKIHDVIETVIGDNAVILGSLEDDHISGNGGDDSISGGHGNDDLYGDLGDDSLSGGSGNDHLYGEAGDDSLTGGDGADAVSGGLGDDSVLGGNGMDTLLGGNGNDKLNGSAGDDSLAGGNGNDTYYVDSDIDRISESSVSTGGYDVEYASVSESGLAANVEKLVMTGTALKGVGNGNANTLVGNTSTNQLYGGAGNDYVAGGLGNDTCVGGLGDDRLTGGRGADRLKGDDGHDIFDFNALNEMGIGAISRDAILDFVHGDDRIDLSTIDANALLANDQAFRFVTSFSANATGEVRYTNGLVQISTDADSQAEYEIALVGVAPSTLSTADFIL